MPTPRRTVDAEVFSPLSFAEERKGAAGGTAQGMRIAAPVPPVTGAQ